MAEETGTQATPPASKTATKKAAVKKAARKSVTKKAATKKSAAKKTPAKKAPAKKAAAKKATARKVPAKKAVAKKLAIRKTTSKNTTSQARSIPLPSSGSQVATSLQGQAKETAGRALNTARELAGVAAGASTQAYQKGVQGAGKAARKARGVAAQTLEKGKRFLKEHPAEAASLGVAGLGVVAAIVGHKKVAGTTASLASKAGKAVSTAGSSIKKRIP